MTFNTVHRVIFGDSAAELASFHADTFELAVTSPPYPMISMWDAAFGRRDDRIIRALQDGRGDDAFELMHSQLDEVWKALYAVLSPGGIVCINIGDATRSIGGSFRVFPNHARILNSCIQAGFSVLPEILWRKQSNKPNKFMGSGMLPPGAYPTQEHEFILVLRKGAKRVFRRKEEAQRRYESAYFWEERNSWFSDVWEDIRGEKQAAKAPGRRTAAFPVELCYRLICMFSITGDTVLDPFLGTGTTTVASIAAGRNSLGIEMDTSLSDLIYARTEESVSLAVHMTESRLESHRSFISAEGATDRVNAMHINRNYGFPVVTAQERELLLPKLQSVSVSRAGTIHASYI